MSIPEPISIMTASLAPGDAIGNYVLTLGRLFAAAGMRVGIYADDVDPRCAGIARPSSHYQPGHGTLWYHYSIYAENLSQVEQPADRKIIDFHGVTPPRLFSGYDAHLADLCRRGLSMLPEYSRTFDTAVVHSSYTGRQLAELGYRDIRKLPLVVDTARFNGTEDGELSKLLTGLPFLLFVGRIVPQKDILAMVEILAALHRRRPGTGLILVGGRRIAPGYQLEIERAIRRHRLQANVLLTGQINDPKMLTSLYRHARFTLLTSEWESFCVPIVESMTFGTPLVVHSTPPLPEVMGECGIIVDKHDPEGAAGAILSLWDDAPTYGQLVNACQTRAREFTEGALAARLAPWLRESNANG